MHRLFLQRHRNYEFEQIWFIFIGFSAARFSHVRQFFVTYQFTNDIIWMINIFFNTWPVAHTHTIPLHRIYFEFHLKILNQKWLRVNSTHFIPRIWHRIRFNIITATHSIASVQQRNQFHVEKVQPTWKKTPATSSHTTNTDGQTRIAVCKSGCCFAFNFIHFLKVNVCDSNFILSHFWHVFLYRLLFSLK